MRQAEFDIDAGAGSTPGGCISLLGLITLFVLLMFACDKSCSEPKPEQFGGVGRECNVDGTCQGQLKCQKQKRVYNWGVRTGATFFEYRCALPHEPTETTID